MRDPLPFKLSLSRLRRSSAAWLSFSLVLVPILLFQNCGKVSILSSAVTPALPTPAPLAQSQPSVSPVLAVSNSVVQTTLNHPVTIQLQTGSNAAVLSLAADSVLTNQTLTNATVSVDSSSQTVLFTPNTGFRGEVAITVYATYGTVTNVQNITVQVQNPTLNFQPALAVRGASCLLCHANIQGDLVSDFGYKTATDTGPDLFASTTIADPTQPNSGLTAFGPDYFGTNPALSSAILNGKLIVPKTDLTKLDSTVKRYWWPNNPLTQTPAITTLAGWLKSTSLPTNTGFLGLSETSSVLIGSPAAPDIISAGALTTQSPQNFFPNTVSDPAISGLTHVQTGTFNYYTNSTTAPLLCEGDLFIDGVVWLNNLNLQTTYGCRIYATHSVFINGPITYQKVQALSNLQITSASGVFMGFGYCVDCDSYAGNNSLNGRWGSITGLGAVPAFRNSSTSALMTSTLADYALITKSPTTTPVAPYLTNLAAQNVTMYDASNSFINQAGTTYSRLLLNAPIVMSRYTGDFQGLVIAEFAMWRLGNFTFTFDPVFTGVALLPFLDFSKIFNVN